MQVLRSPLKMEVVEHESPPLPQPIEEEGEAQAVEGLIVGVIPKGAKQVIPVQMAPVESKEGEDTSSDTDESADEHGDERQQSMDGKERENMRSIAESDFFMQVRQTRRVSKRISTFLSWSTHRVVRGLGGGRCG